jgi:hypothetical protein
MSLVGAAAVALTFAGCAKHGSGVASLREPESAVVAVFDAGKTGRCEEVLALLTQSQRRLLEADRDACPSFVKYLQSHPIEEVHGVVQDGRQAQSKIVRVALKNSETLRSFTVEKEDGRWKLASL